MIVPSEGDTFPSPDGRPERGFYGSPGRTGNPGEKPAVFLGRGDEPGEEVRPVLRRLLELLFTPPAPDPLVMARQELLGHGEAPELAGPRVVRVVEQAVLEAVEADAVGLADDAGDETR